MPRIFKQLNIVKEQKSIETIVSKLNGIKDQYILDDTNVIIVYKNNNKDNDKNGYKMVHYHLLMNNQLLEINSWYLKSYYYGDIHKMALMKELGFFKVQNGRSSFNALYDYKNNQFVIPQGEWSCLDFKYMDQYNGILATFSICSDYEKDDRYSYVNPVTDEKITKSFCVSDGNYYAMLNLDGTIRGNKLFKGNNFSQIEEIIDLSEYESLEEFKKQRKQLCNFEKRKRKQAYQEMISLRTDGSVSPYKDSEVLKILELKK